MKRRLRGQRKTERCCISATNHLLIQNQNSVLALVCPGSASVTYAASQCHTAVTFPTSFLPSSPSTSRSYSFIKWWFCGLSHTCNLQTVWFKCLVFEAEYICALFFGCDFLWQVESLGRGCRRHFTPFKSLFSLFVITSKQTELSCSVLRSCSELFIESIFGVLSALSNINHLWYSVGYRNIQNQFIISLINL